MNNLNNKISAGTIARTAVLALALINQLLSALGKPVLPIESGTLEQLISTGFTTGFGIIASKKSLEGITALPTALLTFSSSRIPGPISFTASRPCSPFRYPSGTSTSGPITSSAQASPVAPITGAVSPRKTAPVTA